MRIHPANKKKANRLNYVLLPLIIALLIIVPVSGYGAEQLKVLEANFTTIQGRAAIDIHFNQPVRYRSHSPSLRARLLSIDLDSTIPAPPAVTPEGEEQKINYRQRIPVSSHNGIPLVSMELAVDDTGARIDVGFSIPVNYQVGQYSGATVVSVLMLDEFHEPLSVPEAPGGAVLKTLPVEEIFRRGKQALQKGDNELAIRIFNKILTLPDNKYTKDALELLAVSRARNNQLAQAKLIYRQYLKKYPEGDDAIRVGQRLAELLSGEYKPQQKLEATKGVAGTAASGAKAYIFSTLSQYYYYNQASLEGDSSIQESALLSTQLTLMWRKRSAGREIKHFIYAAHNYDVEEKIDDGAQINTLYSRVKDSRSNYGASVGRQTSPGGGILGRYDGLDLSYGFGRRWRGGFTIGTPVDASRKDRVQTEKLFFSLRMELDDFIKDWYVTPYYYNQSVESITDREAVGVEIRHFNDVLSVFNQIDYDVFFDELNIYLLRMQIKLARQSTLLFNVDFRRSPLLETSRSIFSDPDITEISQLTDTKTEQELRQLALDLTGDSKLVTVGINQQFGLDWQLNFDLTSSKQTLRTLGEADAFDEQNYYNLRLGRTNLFAKNDSMFTNLRYTETEKYTESLMLLTHRLPFGRSRWQTRVRLSERDAEGDITRRIEPSIKFNYKKIKNADIEVELGVEDWRYSGSAIVESDFRRTYANLGYQYIFD